MVEGIYFCCEFFFTAVKVWATLGLTGVIWEPRVDERKRRITFAATMVLIAGINTYNNMVISVLFSKAFMIVIIFWISWTIYWLYCCRYAEAFCLVYILWMMSALLDLLIQTLVYILLDFAGLQRNILLTATIPRAVYQLMGATVLLWAMKAACRLVQQRKQEAEHCLRWVWLLVLPLFVCVMYFQRIYLSVLSEMLLYYWWLFLFGCLLAVVSLLAYIAVQYARESSRSLQQKMEAIEDEYQIWRQAYEKIEILQHDFSKHKQFIQDLIEAGRGKDALVHLEEIDRALKSDINRNLVNHGMLNLVLNRKMKEGEASGIAVQYEMCDMDGLLLSSVEIVALITNILDNAIEANQELAEGIERWITLACTRKGQMLVICASNSKAGGKLKFKGEIPRTTKTGKGIHGLGMRSIQQVVRQYEGHMQIKAGEDTFKLTVYLKGFA
jgi:hypothetical protein